MQKVKTRKQYIPWDDIAIRLIIFMIQDIEKDDSAQWFKGTLSYNLPQEKITLSFNGYYLVMLIALSNMLNYF